MLASIRRAVFGRKRKTLWTPASLGSNLSAWWSADDLADGAVASWTDRKSGITVTQATGTAQPVRAASSFNSRPGVTFATDDFLEVATVPAAIPLGATAGMIMTATSIGDLTTVNCPASYGSGTILTSRRTTYSTGETPTLSENGGGNAVGVAGSGLGTHLYMGRWAGTTMEGWLDGVNFGPAAIASLNTSNVRLRIGAHEGTVATQFFNGAIRHVFITLDLSVADRQKLEGWTAWDCGIQASLAAGHPYRSVRP